MGTIAEKLSYLTDTKDLFKDRLNSLGATITSSTTFRNYLTWLDTFYGEVSDKTDLSVNGVIGRTSQESTRGINVYNVNSHYVLSDGYSINDENWITNTYDNSKETDHYENIWCPPSSLLKTSTDYLLICEIKSVSGSGILYPYTKHSISAIETQHSSYNFSNLSAGQKILIPVTTKSSFSGVSYDLRTLVRYNAGNSGSITFRLSLLTDTSITSDTFVYEPFTNGASPNPDYPQPINNLSGDVAYKVSGKNLFDEEFRQGNSYNTFITDRIYSNKDVFVEEGKTYTFSTNLNTNTFKWAINISETPHPNSIQVYDSGWKTTSSFTFTASVSGYLGIPIAKSNGTDNLTPSDVSSYNFQLEKGSTATSYEPYIEPQTFTIPLGDIELCKIGDYKDIIKKSTGKNLFDKDNVQLKKTANFNGTDGNEFTITNSNTRTFAIVEVPSNTNITISTGNSTYSTSRYYIACLKSPTIEAGKTSDGWIYNNGTILTTSNTKYLGIVIDSRINGTMQTSTLELINDMNIQLEENSTPTDYEPYGKGKWYIGKQIGKVVLNGSENWQTELYTYYLTNFNAKPYSTFSPTTPYAYANYFKWGNGSSGSFVEGCFWYTLDGSKLRVQKENPLNLNSFKTWLSTHNVIVYYALVEPTTTEITQENYPSLYNALKQIQDYLTAYKINKEFILGYSSPEIEY